MKPGLISHLKSFTLPVTVTVVVPFILLRYIEHVAIGVLNLVPVTLGAIFITAGLALLVSTVLLFHKVGRGTLAPWSATNNLVVTGPYKYSRNPMISGVLLILIGEAILFKSLGISIWVIVFYVLNTFYFIFVEEPLMLRKHGKKYSQYKRQTNRWLPTQVRNNAKN